MKVLRHFVSAALATLAMAGVQPGVASAQVNADITITVAPPARKVEVQYPAPGPNYAWHRGDWVYSSEIGSYVWHAGHWVIFPDATHTVWAPGEWVNFQGGWRYVPGHWRTVAEGPAPEAAKLVEVVKPPPALLVEAVPAPLAGYSWDRGHWAWDGVDYRWVHGHWLFNPREYHSWQPGHWYESNGHWFFHSGFWH